MHICLTLTFITLLLLKIYTFKPTDARKEEKKNTSLNLSLSLSLSQVIGAWKSRFVEFRLRAEPHEHNEVSVWKPHVLFQEVTSSVYTLLTQMLLRGS